MTAVTKFSGVQTLPYSVGGQKKFTPISMSLHATMDQWLPQQQQKIYISLQFI